MPEISRHRLTSWKEIANHLGRGVRTVLRWEKERGLPVHRVPGANGRIVFAFKDELDEWARGGGTAETPVPRRWAGWSVTVAALVVIAVAGAVLTAVTWKDTRPITIMVAAEGIFAVGADGATRWRYGFPAGERGSPLENRFRGAGDVVEGPDAGVIAGTAMQFRDPASDSRGGRLFSFSRGGELRRTFEFDDSLSFGAGPFSGPWVMTDYRIDASPGRQWIAVAAHHYQWWPSMVTVLDDRWNRRGTFVNAGWVEWVWWVDSRRIVIAGFSNPVDGGMIALLDADAIDGASPMVSGRGDFGCTSCGPGRPVRYVVMPRSEVNRVSGSPFNRVVLEPKADGFVARTIEIPASDPGGVADIIYEFSASLKLLRATHSDRYWEAHRALEAQGKIAHSRAACPDRDGPPDVRAWEPSTGWASSGVMRAAASGFAR